MSNSGGVPQDAPTFEQEIAGALWATAKVWADDPHGGDLSHFMRDTLAPRVVAAIEHACDQLTQRGALPECRAAALRALAKIAPCVSGNVVSDKNLAGRGTRGEAE